ncbi:unnamed protein product [Prorocentrum cordatum]|uniref:Uncharacterized protein n=1 Tax=Prorocentrum cordatum TaxID=2364126 RepID=A0ABN9REB0_9DINO|nr:unnamed protein product [Polarella glacialis]
MSSKNRIQDARASGSDADHPSILRSFKSDLAEVDTVVFYDPHGQDSDDDALRRRGPSRAETCLRALCDACLAACPRGSAR